MKWKTNTSKGYYTKWHSWYAWHPKKIDDTWYWLEDVLRCANAYDSCGFFERLFCITRYVYKLKPEYIKIIDNE